MVGHTEGAQYASGLDLASLRLRRDRLDHSTLTISSISLASARALSMSFVVSNVRRGDGPSPRPTQLSTQSVCQTY